MNQHEELAIDGKYAESAKYFIDKLLEAWQKDLFDEFRTVDYQSIDNNTLIVLRIKCNVLSEIRDSINKAIRRGVEAEQEIRRQELNER